jgi:hypothetical protein
LVGVAVVQPRWAAASKERQNKYFKMKELDFSAFHKF